MKSLKLVMIAITAFAVMGIAGCSESIKVPDMSVLRVEVPRISTQSYSVAKQVCRWEFYATKGVRFSKSQSTCVNVSMKYPAMIPASIMQWRRPAKYDSDRCTIKGKLSERCKKVMKIFFMRKWFVRGGDNVNMYGGNIVATNRTLRLNVNGDELFTAQKLPTTTVGVKSVLAWARKMNKLAASAPPANNPG